MAQVESGGAIDDEQEDGLNWSTHFLPRVLTCGYLAMSAGPAADISLMGKSRASSLRADIDLKYV